MPKLNEDPPYIESSCIKCRSSRIRRTYSGKTGASEWIDHVCENCGCSWWTRNRPNFLHGANTMVEVKKVRHTKAEEDNWPSCDSCGKDDHVMRDIRAGIDSLWLCRGCCKKLRQQL